MFIFLILEDQNLIEEFISAEQPISDKVNENTVEENFCSASECLTNSENKVLIFLNSKTKV